MTATEPAQLHTLFTEAINGRDAEGLVALYEPSGLAVHLDGSCRSGEAELRAMVEDMLATIEHIDGETRKVIVAGDIAITSATWRARLAGGGEGAGTTAEVARRQADGTWRWVIDDPSFT
ncbi:hypothetical protein BLA60_08025 [Actinophytocola xinjiangensis]|uniref:DUF4440 domain-containing protein n=1 Tax=Actinophytocola xinjiangensis TaxID=485602 RepID=A0A7Z0WPZ2_9PSEU|nr:SgcJ/EcaC family oxidoreductase [Actinophytocola xinjiangensis]OLF11972.1 hypothetical protein BLA60_08025 [Actinophytocola xinjiangensis]